MSDPIVLRADRWVDVRAGVVRSPATVVVGTGLAITVTEPDRAGHGALTVTVTNDATGESEIVALTESSSGVFTGAVATADKRIAKLNELKSGLEL